MTTAPNNENDFSTLLDQLAAQTTEHGSMAKALDEVSASEADGDGKPKPKKGEPGYVEEDGDRQVDESGNMSKAFQITLPDGTQSEAIDATEIVKALDSDVGQVKKALPQLLGLIRAQGDMIKALTAEVGKFRDRGTGRRSVLQVNDKPALGQGGGGGGDDMQKAGQMSVSDFMLKAEGALKAEAISGFEAAVLNTCIGGGKQPPAEIAAKVLAFKG